MTAADRHNSSAVTSAEFEQQVLGAMLSMPATVDFIRDIVAEADFAWGLHQRLFGIFCRMADRGAITIDLARPFIENDPELQDAGGFSYIARMAANAIGSSVTRDIALALADMGKKRRLRAALSSVIDMIDDPDPGETIDDITAHAEDALGEAQRGGTARDSLVGLGELALRAYEHARDAGEGSKKIAGIPTGLADLDAVIGGLAPGELVIIAGRPSMGKSALATAIARMVGTAGHGSIIFSLEMHSMQLGQRAATEVAFGGHTRVAYRDLRNGTIGSLALDRIRECLGSANVPCLVEAAARMTMPKLRSRAKRAARILQGRGHKLDLVVVDYLQLVRASDRYKGDKVREVGEVSADLKALAKELDCAVIALSQLSRGAEGRDDKRPQLSDLRDSGAIEQDADIVIGLFRPEYYLLRNEPKEDAKRAAWQQEMVASENLCEALVLKNRMGPVQMVKLFFDAPSGAFRSIGRY